MAAAQREGDTHKPRCRARRETGRAHTHRTAPRRAGGQHPAARGGLHGVTRVRASAARRPRALGARAPVFAPKWEAVRTRGTRARRRSQSRDRGEARTGKFAGLSAWMPVTPPPPPLYMACTPLPGSLQGPLSLCVPRAGAVRGRPSRRRDAPQVRDRPDGTAPQARAVRTRQERLSPARPPALA